MSVTGSPLTRGYFGRIENDALVAILPFQFNPTEVTRTKDVDYIFSIPPGAPRAIAFFQGIQGDSFTLQLLFDAVETFREDREGTSAQKAFMESFGEPDFNQFSDDLGQFISPPRARFSMGEESWEVLITNMTFRDVRWNRSLIPTRTWVDIQMRSVFTSIAVLRARFDRLLALRSTVELETTGNLLSYGGE